ncbi:flagellar protein FlaG [Paenibacillus sp. FSL R7-0302]|uniref:flagellar protein FlaG n=1 Tax=Paenibacillus sp. FSL R7-0302 TaxID=2921681 RepID=UPI0030F71202
MNVQFSLSASSIQPSSSKLDRIYNNTLETKKDTSSFKDDYTHEKGSPRISIAEDQLIRTIEKAVKSLQGPQTTLEISIHEKTHDIMVKVLNKETGEIIREVPREKTLDLVAKMMEIAGILVDEKI